MNGSQVVVSDTDTQGDIIESWRHVSQTAASPARTALSDDFIDEIHFRRDLHLP